MIVKTFLVLLINFFLTAISAVAYAHPESGFLPDAIAETEYRIVIDLNPDDIVTRNRLGVVLYRKGKLKEALKQFKAVLAIKPDDFDAHDGTGLVIMKQGRYEDAVKWFKKAIALNKNDAMVYYHLGLAYKMLGDYKGAVKELERTLRLKENVKVSEELKRLEQLLLKKR